MKNRFTKLLFFSGIVILTCCANNVFACLCFGRETPYQSYKEATAVFTGKVIGIKDSQGNEIVKKRSEMSREEYQREQMEGVSYKFAVQEWFKGSKEPEIKVSHDINMCEFRFNIGDEFLIYAFGSEGGLSTFTFCSRTTSLETAQKRDIHFLRDLVKGLPEPRIYGTVRLDDKDPVTNSYRSTYLEGIEIVAQGEKRSYTAITDKNGLFRFDQLPDGKYQVFPRPPQKYEYEADYDTVIEITLTPANHMPEFRYTTFTGSNAYSNILLKWNNKVTGKVLDAEGKPLENGSVKLIPLAQIDKYKNQSFLRNKRTADYIPRENQDSNIRKFMFSGLTPGKHVLALEVYAPFAADREKLRMYYPQESSPQTAQIFNINQLSQKNVDLKLPPGYIVHEIEGSFTWFTGDLVKDGTVSIERKENSDDPDNIVYDSDFIKDGKFKFQVFENAEYWIHAKIYNEKAKPVKIKIGKVNPPIKITLPSLLKSPKP